MFAKAIEIISGVIALALLSICLLDEGLPLWSIVAMAMISGIILFAIIWLIRKTKYARFSAIWFVVISIFQIIVTAAMLVRGSFDGAGDQTWYWGFFIAYWLTKFLFSHKEQPKVSQSRDAS